MRFNVYDAVTDKLVAGDITFNHTLGLLFRSQPYGIEPAHNWFDIAGALHGGFCRLTRLVAIETPDSFAARGYPKAGVGGWKNPAVARTGEHILAAAGTLD